MTERSNPKKSLREQTILPDTWRKTTVLDLWNSQVRLHHHEKYKGISLAKFPQDLWTYEKVISSYSPEVIIEIGVNQGGFTRWLYDRQLVTAIENPGRAYSLIGIDINIESASINLSQLPSFGENSIKLELIKCNLLDSIEIKQIKERLTMLVSQRSTLIIEDSGHTYATTRAALDAFSPLLKAGEWFIVEDTCVDIDALRESPEWPTGALNAANDFLLENDNFERTNINHLYTLTCHPFGFLRKKSSSTNSLI